MVSLSDLERLIRDNYKYINDPKVLLATETFLKENPEPSSLPDMSASSITNIAKMVSFARKEWLVQKAGAVYDAPTWTIALNYCKHGLNRLELSKPEPTLQTPESRKFIHCILNDHAGNFLFKLSKIPSEAFKKEKNLTDAYQHYSNAIEIGVNLPDKRIIAYTFAYRGNVSKEISDLRHGTERIGWLIKAAADTLESGVRTREFDKRHAAYQYSIAGKLLYRTAAVSIRTPERQVELLNQAIMHQQTALELHELNPRFQAEEDYSIAKYYDLLFKIGQKVEDARSALKYYELSEKWLLDSNLIKRTATKRIQELKAVCT